VPWCQVLASRHHLVPVRRAGGEAPQSPADLRNALRLHVQHGPPTAPDGGDHACGTENPDVVRDQRVRERQAPLEVRQAQARLALLQRAHSPIGGVDQEIENAQPGRVSQRA
jgi:hypothetical protein